MNRKVHVNDQLSPNSIFLVGKVTGDEVVFLRDPMFVLDGTLQSIFGTSSKVFGDLRILSEPHEKSWHSQDKNVTPIYKFNKTLQSVHFGVVVVELINCKCGGIVRNQIW